MAPRRACKIDGNQKEIVEGLRGYGLTVESLAPIGNGCPDLLVGGNGKNVLIEIKVKGLALNPLQTTWHREWLGKVFVVNSLRGAFKVCVDEGVLILRDKLFVTV